MNFLTTGELQDESIDNIFNMYADVLESKAVVKAEVALWRKKWEMCDAPSKPDSAIDSLKACNSRYFPNLHKLLKVNNKFVCMCIVIHIHIRL